jgi:hypothetical protein
MFHLLSVGAQMVAPTNEFVPASYEFSITGTARSLPTSQRRVMDSSVGFMATSDLRRTGTPEEWEGLESLVLSESELLRITREPTDEELCEDGDAWASCLQ